MNSTLPALNKNNNIHNYQSNLPLSKRNLSSAKSTKLFSHQATHLLYQTKINHLQKQSQLLTKQINQLQSNINTIRTNQTQNHTISNTNQVTIADNHIQKLRKKIDTNKDKNRNLMKEIDQYRKQIVTLKNLINHTNNQLQKVNQIYLKQLKHSQDLFTKIGQQNTQLERKKILSITQKANLIKQYQNMLNKINNELKQQSNNKQVKQFYITQIIKPTSTKPSSANKNNTIQYQSDNIRDKLINYQQQFQVIKNLIGSNNPQQITQDFLARYQQNYQKYTFIQNRLQYLYELKNSKQQLIQNKTNIINEIHNSKTDNKQIIQLKNKLITIEQEKMIQKNKLAKFETIYQNLKIKLQQFIKNCNHKIGETSLKGRIVQQKTIQEILSQINKVVHIGQNNHAQYLIKLEDKNIQQQFEALKKESEVKDHHQKFYTRNDFINFKVNKDKKQPKKSSRNK